MEGETLSETSDSSDDEAWRGVEVGIALKKLLKRVVQGAELPYPCSYPGTGLRDVCGSRQAANTFTTTQAATATATPAYACIGSGGSSQEV